MLKIHTTENPRKEIKKLKSKISKDLHFKSGIEVTIHNLVLNYSSMLKLLSIENVKVNKLKRQVGGIKKLITSGQYVEALNSIDNGFSAIDFNQLEARV